MKKAGCLIIAATVIIGFVSYNRYLSSNHVGYKPEYHFEVGDVKNPVSWDKTRNRYNSQEELDRMKLRIAKMVEERKKRGIKIHYQTKQESLIEELVRDEIENNPTNYEQELFDAYDKLKD
jgi:hypothetical protein